MKVYYNEIDDYCVQVLYELMCSGLIPEGDMDTRSIEDVRPSDIVGYNQCHFFAGIGVWAYVTKEMGRLWTGSCPCQPFSRAGKGEGFADQRHLWPAFHWLIEQCRPPVVLGEQVGGKAALPWLDLVQDDLEGSGYAFGQKDFPACSVGAPHIRQRIYWCGIYDDDDARLEGYRDDKKQEGWKNEGGSTAQTGGDGGLSDNDEHGWEQGSGDDSSAGYGQTAPTSGFWRDVEWLPYKDGKWRPIKPGTFPLAHGFAGRIPLLSALGNTLVAPQAKIFAETVMEWMRKK